MALTEGQKTNFNTLVRAAKSGHLALIECNDRKTGVAVATLVAVHVDQDSGEYVMSPLAKQFEGNPYEELEAPVKED